MTSVVNEYLMLVHKLRDEQRRDPHYLRTERFDVLNHQLDKLWHVLTETEINYIELKLKETDPTHLEFTREVLGLKRD